MCPTHGHGRCSGAPKPEPPSGEKGTNGWSTKTRSTTTNHSVGSKFNRRMLLHDVDNRTIASQVRTPRNRKMLSAPNVAYLHSLSLCVAVCGGYGHTDAAVLHSANSMPHHQSTRYTVPFSFARSIGAVAAHSHHMKSK